MLADMAYPVLPFRFSNSCFQFTALDLDGDMIVVRADEGAAGIVKVRVGVAGLLDLAAVDAKLLPELADHAILWLARQKHVEVNAEIAAMREIQQRRRKKNHRRESRRWSSLPLYSWM